MLATPERFSSAARERVEAPDNDLFLSAASCWEIAIKYAAGKLRLPAPPAEYLQPLLDQIRTIPLPVDHRHAFRVAHLPLQHRDPFDRILIAQAQIEGFPIMTSDPRFAAYDVEVLGT